MGENISKRFLMKQGFSVIDTNYYTRLGEIDIIARKESKYYFFEVKTIVSYETVSRETYMPQNNLTHSKLRKISYVATIYLDKRLGEGHNTYWQIGFVGIILSPDFKKVKIDFNDNVI
ncbi:MAG: YraN family protein [Candidatus Pacebacteria bacterium]|nr:YraN family protein [Candidatus Paceibacterota bacterium]